MGTLIRRRSLLRDWWNINSYSSQDKVNRILRGDKVTITIMWVERILILTLTITITIRDLELLLLTNSLKITIILIINNLLIIRYSS